LLFVLLVSTHLLTRFYVYMSALSLLLSTLCSSFILVFFNDTATTEIYTLSLHDALPILLVKSVLEEYKDQKVIKELMDWMEQERSEEHTSELQSRFDLVGRLLLEKKKQ